MRDLTGRFIAAGLLLGLSAGAAMAQGYEHHNGYTRQNGTYVEPYYSTHPDGNPLNNWSTQGNTNPFTGQAGTHNPYPSTVPYGGSRRW